MAAGTAASTRSSPNSRTEVTRLRQEHRFPLSTACSWRRPLDVPSGSRPALIDQCEQDGAGQAADSQPQRDETNDVPLVTHAPTNMPPRPSLPGTLQTSRRREVTNPTCVRSGLGKMVTDETRYVQDGLGSATRRARIGSASEIEAAELRDPARSGAGGRDSEAQFAGVTAPGPLRAAKASGSFASLRTSCGFVATSTARSFCSGMRAQTSPRRPRPSRQ
jgi:hypothetical protein